MLYWNWYDLFLSSHTSAQPVCGPRVVAVWRENGKPRRERERERERERKSRAEREHIERRKAWEESAIKRCKIRDIFTSWTHGRATISTSYHSHHLGYRRVFQPGWLSGPIFSIFQIIACHVCFLCPIADGTNGFKNALLLLWWSTFSPSVVTAITITIWLVAHHKPDNDE